MSSKHRIRWTVLAGVALPWLSSAAFALTVPYSATQGPKPNLLVPTPPTLSQAVQSAVDGFGRAVTVLGRNEFDTQSPQPPQTPSTGFSYTGGTGTLLSTTGVTIINGDGLPNSELQKGRYNLTPGVINPSTGGPSYGHWLEATGDFTYRFSSAVSAFGFYGTDFGDFSGQFTIEFLSGSTQVYSTALSNAGGNGNLLFFGLSSSSTFDSVVFHITQIGPDIDVLGFDSFIVGRANTIASLPEPGSLALVGLALAGACASARRRTA